MSARRKSIDGWFTDEARMLMKIIGLLRQHGPSHYWEDPVYLKLVERYNTVRRGEAP